MDTNAYDLNLASVVGKLRRGTGFLGGARAHPGDFVKKLVVELNRAKPLELLSSFEHSSAYVLIAKGRTTSDATTILREISRRQNRLLQLISYCHLSVVRVEQRDDGRKKRQTES